MADVAVVVSDAQNEDSGNYTCEVHGGSESTVLAHVLHYVFVRGQSPTYYYSHHFVIAESSLQRITCYV